MKNTFLKETLIFCITLSAMFVFFSSSKSNFNSNARIVIKVNDTNLIDKKNKLHNDLNSLKSISNVDISTDTDVIVLDINNEHFDVVPVKKIFDKWEIDYEDEFDTSVIADSEF